MAKIEVENLTKIFGKKPKKALPLLEEGYSKDEILEKTGNTVGVNSVDFSVEENEIFVIMGLSGSGKSTLLRCINRLIEPTEGKIEVDGINIMELNNEELREQRKEKFGMVFQNFGLFPNRTVIDNAAFGLEIQKVDKETRRKKAREALKKVGLEGYEEQKPDQLSGGMQQRVGLARALAVDTDIMLMDEPFSALDPLIKKDMQDQLLDLHQNIAKTIIFITHDLDEALKLGDKIAIMKDGEIVQLGNQEEILTDAANDYVAEFVQDVNRSRVLTAEDIMGKPLALLYEGQGPRTALHKMNEENLTSIMVVNRENKYIGVLSIDGVKEMLDNDEKDIKPYLLDIPKASPCDTLDELFTKMTDIETPLPVLDAEGKLKGNIVKTNVIANLAAQENSAS
ncbi:glycine betaine/L-proline ABC transporter ATP-binding protein [Halanaerobiaceae bacterium Z-7014]|uniref:Quaternary amine transport ATP-binding protein n=1 Tax=Halonatronomonas betaini TaxID=2778430 RepID=A0A931F5F1_9FIRM|nr:glycine betaine/L-proline ABC transporter ATP-binding protein [Halonatronomonas betaini]